MILLNFSEKLHEIEKILGRGGRGRVAGDAPLRSANVTFKNDCIDLSSLF